MLNKINIDDKLSGKYIAYGKHFSKDYGSTWVNVPYPIMDISHDGKYILAANNSSYGGIYISEDYGNTWRNQQVSFDEKKGLISANGKVMVGLSFNSKNDQSYFSISKDYGKTWRNLSSGGTGITNAIIAKNSECFAISPTGNQPAITTNGGTDWVVPDFIGYNGSSIQQYNIQAISSDGKYSIAIGDLNHMFVSSNYGNTFNYVNIKLNISNITSSIISNDGRCMYCSATDEDSQYKDIILLISEDFGLTWKKISKIYSIRLLDASLDGNILYYYGAFTSLQEIGVYTNFGKNVENNYELPFKYPNQMRVSNNGLSSVFSVYNSTNKSVRIFISNDFTKTFKEKTLDNENLDNVLIINK